MRRGMVPWMSALLVLLVLGLGIGWNVVATGGQPPFPPIPTPHPNPTLFPTVVLPPMTPLTGPPPTERPPAVGAEQEFFARSTPRPEDPYHLSIDAFIMPGRIEEQINKASVIVIGRVQQVGPARWTTPDGKRPHNPFALDSQATIFRPVVLEVERYLKGEQPAREFVLYALGGVVGQDSVTWTADDVVEFVEGARVLVFLSQVRDDSNQLGYGQIWVVWDRYTITEDDRAINTYRNEPLNALLIKIAEAEKSQ